MSYICMQPSWVNFHSKIGFLNCVWYCNMLSSNTLQHLVNVMSRLLNINVWLCTWIWLKKWLTSSTVDMTYWLHILFTDVMRRQFLGFCRVRRTTSAQQWATWRVTAPFAQPTQTPSFHPPGERSTSHFPGYRTSQKSPPGFWKR